MGTLEAVAEGQRRFLAERNSRLEAEAAALAAKQAEEAETARNADRDQRREEARRDARLAYMAKWQSGGAWIAARNAASAARSAFDAALAEPKPSVEKLFAAYSDEEASMAVVVALRDSLGAYLFRTTHPGEQPLPRYLDRTPKPAFDGLLLQVVAARSAAAASTAAVPNDVFSLADKAGEAAAKAVQS
jgi:hypothetical protein